MGINLGIRLEGIPQAARTTRRDVRGGGGKRIRWEPRLPGEQRLVEHIAASSPDAVSP